MRWPLWSAESFPKRLGDHVLIVGEVVDAHVNREGAALTMKEAGFRYSG